MSNNQPNNPDQSQVKQAIDNADAEQISENLDTSNVDKAEDAESLTEEQKTPFIDDSVRTDK
jgi:hypothetical protein